MGFWVFAGGLAVLTVALLLRALLRGRAAAAEADVAGIALYREQLAAVAKDAEAGRIDAGEAERLELEIKRRLLEADRAAQGASGTGRAPRELSLGAAVIVAAVVLAGTGGLYWVLGAPGYGDAPIAARIAAAEEYRQTRMRQADAVARFEQNLPDLPDPDISEEFKGLMAQLRTAVAERPDDLQGHVLLVRNEAAMGNFGAAAKAQESVLRIKGEDAGAQDYLLLAQLWITEAGGYVSPEAEAALAQALRRDSENVEARYYWGLMRAQTGRPDLAFNVWRRVMDELPPDAPWAADLPTQIAAAARAAGVDYTPPAPASGGVRGPSAEDMAAAQDMSPEDRQAFIRSMVDGLAEELATDGGTPEKWAQLVRALGVLGEVERQAEIVAEAREVFDGSPEAIALIEAAAGGGE
ncbi:c-type cytochrome biogenesis protein CcmI [Vannielia litorea]|uniref:c-type cytochrome biogenesis protein CcmI n=1 Tax=Vannielia litorea TaxID=1217970 RepID=UPI001C953124|nr:c-type cytochrome biogenesis protein CcmI [Vannielia litorea]MBY6046762.1 c-type cytochrome biogenesis protein CcmI [Vannielia litorea]MBY6074176.1 c-type cytochrome biogenesis protein CcmI [Vannielia litorea]